MKLKFSIILIISIIISVIISVTSILSYESNENSLYEKAKVLNILEENIQEDTITPGLYLGYQQIEVEVLTGKYKGEVYNLRNPLSRLYNVHTKKDMEIVLKLDLKDNKLANISVFNYKRSNIIYVLIGLFFIALIVFGKMNGVKSIISLIFTGIMIIFFMLPLIFNGYDPIFIAIITISIITIISLFLVSGFNKKTVSAIIGTILGVTVAGLISFVAGNIAHLSGLTMNEAEELIYISGDTSMKVRGLMFAAILIASLGAIMDVSMSIASSIFEFNNINEKLTKKELFNSGMNVGRDVMGTMSNTLILAFAGSSLNIMLLIMAYKMPYTQLINLDLIGTELIQGISGSIGIVLTVPITALVTVFFLKKKTVTSANSKL